MLALLFCGEFLLHIPCRLNFYNFLFIFLLALFRHTMLPFYFIFLILGVSITHPVLAFTCGEFLLHIPCWLYIYLGSFSYTSRSGFIFICGVSLTHPTLALLFCREFLTHPMLAFYFIFIYFLFWGVSLTHPVLASFLCGEFRRLIPYWLYFYLGSFSYTSHSCFIFRGGGGVAG